MNKLNLDFNDISGPAQHLSEQAVVSKLTGINLQLGKEVKDITHFTDDEFLLWCGSILPGVSFSTTDIVGIDNKIKTFEKIVTLSQFSLFSSKNKSRGQID
jgi:hypothetical protein